MGKKSILKKQLSLFELEGRTLDYNVKVETVNAMGELLPWEQSVDKN